MTAIKLKLRLPSDKGNPGTIVYVITHSRKSRCFTTDYQVYPYEWDSENKVIVPTGDLQRVSILNTITKSIKSDMTRFRSIIRKLNQIGFEYTVDDVASEFKRLYMKQSFFGYMQSVIDRLHILGKTGTSNNYKYSLNSFKLFRGNEDIRIEQMTPYVIEEYEAWLKNKGVKPNSSSFYMRNLRAVYNRAVDDGLAIDVKPFDKTYTGTEKTAKRAISLLEIKRIKELDLRDKPILGVARDIFMFQFYAMGISFIDAAYLTKRNIVGNTIIYRRHKTNQEVVLPLCSHIISLINKYSSAKSEYLMPIITSTYPSGRDQYQNMIHHINSTLKKVGKLAGISIPLTTYVSRHSWASIAKEKGIDIATISDALGHDNIKTTEIYLSSISTDRLYLANARILEDL